MAERGEISEKKVSEWEHETPKKVKENLPYHVKKSSQEIANEVLSKLGANLPKNIGVFTAGSGGPKALERVMKAERSIPRPPPAKPDVPIEWRKSMAQRPAPQNEMLKFFSLKEGQIPASPNSPVGSSGMPTETPTAASVGMGKGNQAPAFGQPGKMGSALGLLGKFASADPSAVEAAVLKASGPGGGSKLWQSLTGLSDDVLLAGMNMKEKQRRALERGSEKNAAETLASSILMLTKMSEVPKKQTEDKLKGGLADNKPASDFDPDQMEMGKKVELEHTDDPQLAEEIAKDHLDEIKDYYTRLNKMEDEAPKSAAAACDTPGEKIRSKGKGRGEAHGKGEGPLGRVRQMLEDEEKKAALTRAERGIYENEDAKRRHFSAMMASESPMKTAEMLRESPLYSSTPLPQSSPSDILQLLKAQALIEQQQQQMKMGQINDPGDGPHLPYQMENENSGDQMPMGDIQAKMQQQAMLERLYAEQMRAKQVEDTYKGKVRRGELIGGIGGLLGGGLLGHVVSAGTGVHMPATFLSAGAGGLLGKHIGQGIGQQQGLEYLHQYSGVPWGIQR